jgi:pilus assembly protein Flp/PilA
MVSRLLKSFLAARDGATAIEYGLIAALIGVTIVTGIGAIGGNLQTIVDTVATAIESVR